uniref:Uncharacterized protein n=1 Tax=Knipowitschia caucasica TaxID=637954 RepID=A0AAV2JB74_KNICA
MGRSITEVYQTEVQVSPCKHIQARKHHFPPPPPPSRTRAIPQTVLTKLGTQGERPTTPSISTQHSNMDLYERPDQGMSGTALPSLYQYIGQDTDEISFEVNDVFEPAQRR